MGTTRSLVTSKTGWYRPRPPLESRPLVGDTTVVQTPSNRSRLVVVFDQCFNLEDNALKASKAMCESCAKITSGTLLKVESISLGIATRFSHV